MGVLNGGMHLSLSWTQRDPLSAEEFSLLCALFSPLLPLSSSTTWITTWQATIRSGTRRVSNVAEAMLAVTACTSTTSSLSSRSIWGKPGEAPISDSIIVQDFVVQLVKLNARVTFHNSSDCGCKQETHI